MPELIKGWPVGAEIDRHRESFGGAKIIRLKRLFRSVGGGLHWLQRRSATLRARRVVPMRLTEMSLSQCMTADQHSHHRKQ